MDFKILMRTTSGVWLPGCIPVGSFDLCVITGLTSFFERGNLTYVACPTIVRRKSCLVESFGVYFSAPPQIFVQGI